MAGVSYVVTVYNKAAFLPAVLNSIAVELSESGGEIVIVDDGSTDQSPALISSFAQGRGNVKHIRQENAGVAAATNRAIAAASEKYLRLVDGDDCIVPGSTRLLIDALGMTGCKFAFGQFVIGDIEIARPSPSTRILDDPLRRMLHRQPFIPATTLGDTAVMQKVLPLPEDFRTAQDFSLGVKLARLTSFAEISAVCCVQPPDSGGLSRNKAGMFRETVLLALQLGEEQAWPATYRRMAIARSAGRARNYLRRHVKGHTRHKMGISILAVMAKFPFFWPYKRLMTYVANAYSLSQ